MKVRRIKAAGHCQGEWALAQHSRKFVGSAATAEQNQRCGAAEEAWLDSRTVHALASGFEKIEPG
jgi:hypothetical protein